MLESGGGGGRTHVEAPDGWQPERMNDPMTGKPIEVKTDELGDFGRTLYWSTMTYFAPAQARISGALKMGAGEGYGEGPIGRDSRFDEAVDLASTCRDGVTHMDGYTDLINIGCQALSTVAMTMAEKYGITDIEGAGAITTSALNDAFKPSDAAKSVTKERLELEEENRLATLPRVDPYDVKYYLMSGQRPGVDFVIADSPAPTDPNDPMNDGNPYNGETDVRAPDDRVTKDAEGKDVSDEGNQFYRVSPDDDWQDSRSECRTVGAPDDRYLPPPPPVPED